MENPCNDIIGDIHGHADELVELLEALGYQKAQGVYRHSERRVIFLGDFIDRGPKIRQVLEIVLPMIGEGKAGKRQASRCAGIGMRSTQAFRPKPPPIRHWRYFEMSVLRNKEPLSTSTRLAEAGADRWKIWN